MQPTPSPSSPNTRGAATAATVFTLALAAVSPAWGASHSDAPAIKQDPQANITDVYAFIGTKYNDSGQRVLNVVVGVRPFSEPGDGVIYDRFAGDARYSIHIADPNTGKSLDRYDFFFSQPDALVSPALKNPDTILSYGLGNGTAPGPILSVGDSNQNFLQAYNVKKNGKIIGSSLLTPPPNVGRNTTPLYNDASTGKAVSGATNLSELDGYTRQTIWNLSNGMAAFAGSRDDGFYADTPAIFDLLDPRILDNNGNASDGLGQDGGGVDGFKGFNVLTFGLQIPVNQLPAIAYPTPFFGEATGVGVYATVSRPKVRVLKGEKGVNQSGPFVQVNRMGNPLFNEVFVALRDKDRYNALLPTKDVAEFQNYALRPELAQILNAVFGTDFEAENRTDLASIFIPDVLRVDTRTGPVRLAGQSGFNRLSFIGGDIVTGTTSTNAGGWPNGRRFGDDVIDIALTALASGPSYSSILVVGDNVAANDQLYHQVFPYAATPHAGPCVDMRLCQE